MQIDICYADWYLLWVLTLWILQTWVIKIVISLPFHFKTVLVKQSMVMEAADWNAKTRTVKQNSPNRKNSTLYTKRTEQMFGAWQQCLISCMSNQFTLSAFSMNLKDLYPRATKAHRVHWRINSFIYFQWQIYCKQDGHASQNTTDLIRQRIWFCVWDYARMELIRRWNKQELVTCKGYKGSW